MSSKSLRWIAFLILFAVVVLAVRLIGPAVPNEIHMLTGLEGTTFHDDGLRYQQILARHGVTVHLIPTSGSAENLSRLIEEEVPTAAFVAGLRDTTGRAIEIPQGVESLGTMYLQPLWVFASKGADVTDLPDLRGLRVEAGQPGSDSRLLAFFLLEEEGIGKEVDFGQNHPSTADQVRDAVEKDRFAALIAVGEPDSELIEILLRSTQLQAMSIRRAEAFALKHRFLKVVRFPEGGLDIRANIPDRDLQLLAARTQLLVSDLFPPALADLLLQAASEIHGAPSAFAERGEFPSSQTGPLPLNRAASIFYTEGPSKLHQFLPFRLAAWIDRFLAAGVAIASAAVTLFNIAPALISMPFKRRIKQEFAALQDLERSAAKGTDKETLLEELDKIDQATDSMKPPFRSTEPKWLELRQYIHDMRDRLQAL